MSERVSKDTNGCSCQGSAVDSDCPQHGQYSEQGEIHRNSTVATEGAAKCHHTVSNGFIEVKDSALNGFKTVTLSDDDGREIKLRLSRRVTVFLWEMLSPHVKVEPLE